MPVESNFTPGQVLTAAQLNAQFGAAAAQTDMAAAASTLAQIQNGTATDAATLTGAETAPVSRGSGLLQTTWNTVAAFVLSIFTLFIVPLTGAVKRSIVGKLLDLSITPNDFGALGNVLGAADGAMTSGSATLTSASGRFAASDVGKLVSVPGAGTSGAILSATISAYVSATQVTLSIAASTTVSAAAYSYGTDDTSALQAWLNAAIGGRLLACTPAAVYGFTNLTLPSPTPYTGSGVDQPRGFGLVIEGNNAILKKMAAGTDATYGIASTYYLSNSTSTNTPIRISNLTLDFNGLATTAGLITQHWNSLFEKMTVFGAAGHGHMQTAVAKGGAAVTGLMNNNNWVGCDLFGNGGYGLYVNPGAGHNNTDGILDRVRAFDNKLANVNIQNCQGWDFANVHAWNFSVPQTDIAVSIYANTGPTKWRGCEFDNDTNNTALPCVDVTNGAGGSVGGVFVGGYAYSPVSLRNSSGSRTVYTATAFELNNSAYFYLNGSNIALLSTTGIYQSANPFQSLVNDGTNSATSSFDSWNAQGVLLNGRHTLTKGSVAPYIGGYAYQPLKGPTYNIAASGATYAMRYGDSLVQLFSTALTAAITIQLPPKANIANGQPPFEFQRQASATGAFNIVIQDVDTSSTIATLTTAGTYQKIIFDGFNWKTAGSGSL